MSANQKSPLRSMSEDEICLHLYRCPADVRKLDVELLTGKAKEFAEQLELAPTLAELTGVVWYIAHVSQNLMPKRRAQMCAYAAWLHRESRQRRSLRSFDELVAALEQLRKLEDTGTQKPAGVIRIRWLHAIDQWRKELNAGVGGQRENRPSTWRFDDLWRAACHELTARELQGSGLRTAAQDELDRAATALTREKSAA